MACECVESTDINNPFPVISGAKWEFASDWDCGGNDIGFQSASSWDGTTATVVSRADCARKCLDAANCLSFNYPDPGSHNGMPSERCHWKHTNQQSAILGKTCGSSSADWQYYTLLEKNPTC